VSPREGALWFIPRKDTVLGDAGDDEGLSERLKRTAQDLRAGNYVEIMTMRLLLSFRQSYSKILAV
jgi:pilus assembly protein TadC